MCQDLRNIGIETFITANGAHVKYQDRVIHKMPIAKEIVHAVKAFAEDNKQSLSFFTEQLSMNNVQEEKTLKAMQETLSLLEFPDINEDILTQEIYLMCLYGDEILRKSILQNSLIYYLKGGTRILQMFCNMMFLNLLLSMLY